MALKRTTLKEPAATLRIVAPTAAATTRSYTSGWVGALGALARLEAFQRGVRLLSYAVLGALIGILALVALSTLPTLFGYHTYVVNGGSMGPSLSAGSVAVSKPTSTFDLEIGDVIARRDSETGPPILHRIVDITVEDGQRLITTQGDANRTPDPQPVALAGTGDRVVFSVPFAGYILDFAGSGLGMFLLIGTPLALLAAMFLRERSRAPRQGKGPRMGTAPEERADDTLPLETTPPTQDDEAPRRAAAVLRQPAWPWRRAAVLVLLPLAMLIGLVLAEQTGVSRG